MVSEAIRQTSPIVLTGFVVWLWFALSNILILWLRRADVSFFKKFYWTLILLIPLYGIIAYFIAVSPANYCEVRLKMQTMHIT